MTELAQRRCRECGKWFTPKSKNQIYCEELHYRPCPVCGKLVEAKYLSDPARCCSNECKAVMRSNTRQSARDKIRETVNAQIITSGLSSAKNTIQSRILSAGKCDQEMLMRQLSDVRRYIFGPVLGFQTNHEYALDISRPKGSYVYEVSASYDFTSKKAVDLMIPISSESSICRYFMKGE